MVEQSKLRADRFGRRFTQLQIGLLAYGLSMALMIESELGLDPWDVFHQGVAARTGLGFGTVVILTGAAVLLAWIPLRQRPGLGTVSNVIVIGIATRARLNERAGGYTVEQGMAEKGAAA